MMNIAERTGCSLAMMDSVWNKGGKGQSIEQDFTPKMPSLNALKGIEQLQPDWNRIPSKEVKMSDEEFEEAIKALANADAEKAKKTGKALTGAGKEYMQLLTEYISAASPDRKAAYAKYNGVDDVIYNSSNQEMLKRGVDGQWLAGSLTRDETARSAKFGEIYLNAIKEYEEENGKIPYNSNSVKSILNPYSPLGAYSSNALSSYNNIYNLLA